MSPALRHSILRGATGVLTPLLIALGCARAPHEITPVYGPSWSLRVENNHVLDLDVFVIHGGQRSRVGTVTAAQARQFHLPMYLLGPGGEISLVATRIGGPGELKSEMIIVERGAQVDWFIPRAFEHSAVSVR
jgi:hypothetical protein